MVVGENPKQIVEKYASDYKSEPYVKYKYLNAKKYQDTAIKAIQTMLDNVDKIGLQPTLKEALQARLDNLSKLTPFEYYRELTDGMYYNENGDALSTENPDGKYSSCRVGKNLCIPLVLKDGSEVFSAKASDVDWNNMHMVKCDIYKLAWRLFHGEIEPSNEQEQQIYDNIKDQKKYFDGFDCEDDYVNYNCSYWNYAYLDENGWVDGSDYKNYEWITSFYEKFVTKLNPDDIITIYECSK